eukprot:5425824-Pleurochrysis_carterae.AAC.2
MDLLGTLATEPAAVPRLDPYRSLRLLRAHLRPQAHRAARRLYAERAGRVGSADRWRRSPSRPH